MGVSITERGVSITEISKDRAEPEGYEGGQTYLWMNEKGHTNTSDYKPYGKVRCVN
jgi:hypothetical protein